MKYTIIADITLRGASITVDSRTPITNEELGQIFIDAAGFGANDFDLNLVDEEIEVSDAYVAEK